MGEIAWVPDSGYLSDAARSYSKLAAKVNTVMLVILQIKVMMEEAVGRTGSPSGLNIEAVKDLASKRPRNQAAAVQAIKRAVLFLPTVAGLYDVMLSNRSGINKECLHMFNNTRHFFRAISRDEVKAIICSGRLGTGTPQSDGGNPTGMAFGFVSLTCNIFSAFFINKIIIVFDAIAVRKAGVIRVLYDFTGVTDADVEGIDDPKPVSNGDESEARIERGTDIDQLCPVGVVVLKHRGSLAIRGARRLAGYLGVPVHILDWNEITGTMGVTMARP